MKKINLKSIAIVYFIALMIGMYLIQNKYIFPFYLVFITLFMIYISAYIEEKKSQVNKFCGIKDLFISKKSITFAMSKTNKTIQI